MNPLLKLIKEREAFVDEYWYKERIASWNLRQWKEYNRKTLITLLEANCERLRGEISERYKTDSKDDAYLDGCKFALNEELALYGALIKELKAN